MRLLNTKSLELSSVFVASEVPDYAILSHRWDVEEVTFAQLAKAPISDPQSPTRRTNGFVKVQGACNLALRNGYEWIWIDSCCIDKSSSAEVQEAINSMWRYYRESNICYVYMADVPDRNAGWGEVFGQSEWFTRGWTLQELIAPIHVEFYTKQWEPIGTKFERHETIASITSIDSRILVHQRTTDSYSTARMLSWAAHREVTKEEDESYSLLGLFDVNLPLLYGEGRSNAFRRLQEAIYNSYTDHSLFLFRHSFHEGDLPLLADSPTRFCERIGCTVCQLQGNDCFPAHLTYRNVIASRRWYAQAHEQIMISSAKTRNEVSTVLPLLRYKDVSRKLKHFNQSKKLDTDASHVAILNFTLQEYPEGALCLLLYRWHGHTADMDAYVRLRQFPVILPEERDTTSKLHVQKTKILVVGQKGGPQHYSRIKTVISFESGSFSVENWKWIGGSGDSITPIMRLPDSGVAIMTEGFDSFQYSTEMLCELTSVQDRSLPLSIRLIRWNKTWSIKEVCERKGGSAEQILHPLFLTDNMADRCTAQLSDGRGLSVELQRLPGSSRATQGGDVLKVQYHLSLTSQRRLS